MVRSDWSVKVARAILCATAALSLAGNPPNGGRAMAADAAVQVTSETGGASSEAASDGSADAAADTDSGKPNKPAKAAKKPAVSRSGAKAGGRARAGAGAGGAVSRGGLAGGTASGGGMCGPAAMSSLLGSSGGMPGFSLLAAIGVQSNYGGGSGLGGGSSQATASGGSGGTSLADGGANGGTEVDVTVKVRVRVGSGAGGEEKECKKHESGSTTTSNGSNSSSETSNGSEQTTGSGLEARILAFAEARLGTQVGNGECWTLAAEALKAAGAEPPLQYVFGREVSTSDVRPGMVLQFESARFEGPGYYQVYGAPNHTAIVASVRGSTVQILHQNVNGDRTVQYGELKLGDLVSGTLTVYQPLPKGTSLLDTVR